MYADKTLKCKECGEEFVFTAGEQEFYAAHSFDNVPKLCKSCRTARGATSSNSERPAKEMYKATCCLCGREARLPFRPRPERRVYCSNCYAKMRETHNVEV